MILSIDGNNIFYRLCSYLAYQNADFLEKPDDFNVLKTRVLSSICNIIEKLDELPESIFFVVDNDKNWRADLNLIPYKTSRKYDQPFDREKLKTVIKEFGEMVKDKFGWCYMNLPGMEGDDLLYFIAEDGFNNRQQSVTIVSSDADIQQLVKSNGSKYIAVYDASGDKQKFIIDQDYGIVKNDEFNGIFDLPDSFSILHNKHERINPVEHAFIKIIGGDMGDDVPSVYIKKLNNNKHTSFGNNYTKSMYKKFEYDKKYGTSLIDTMLNDEYVRRTIASNILAHMHSNEVNKISEISNNILRNMKFVYLHESTYTPEMIEMVKNSLKLYHDDYTMNNLYRDFLKIYKIYK